MKTNMFLMLITCAMVTISCNSKNEDDGSEHEVLPPDVVEMNDAQCRSAHIELGTVEYKELSSGFKVNGLVSVSPKNLVSVSAIMGGYIKSTELVQGSPVTKGQTIVVIENPEFIELQQNYLESKSKLSFAEADYNRQKDLYKENVSSAKTFQLAESEYKTLQSSVAALEQKLRMIGIDAKNLTVDKISGTVSLYSPINGYVKSVNFNVGKYVSPTDVIVEIVNTQDLTLELTIFEKDIDMVTAGQRIRFTMPAKPDLKMSAEVYQVGKALNDDKTIKVYCAVENGNKYLLPGMYINALIETKNDSVTALPAESVISFEDKNYIFIYSERKKEGEKFVTLFKAIEVEKGASENGYIEVILPKEFDIAKSKVVIKGAYNLISAWKNAGDMAC